mgnify:CR=1 FL=1
MCTRLAVREVQIAEQAAIFTTTQEALATAHFEIARLTAVFDDAIKNQKLEAAAQLEVRDPSIMVPYARGPLAHRMKFPKVLLLPLQSM